MKWSLQIVLGLTALMMVSSCAPTYESKGNKAYKAAQNAQGDTKRRLEKEAYLYYRKAVKAHPDKINNQLRNRFVEMTVNRANMVLTEGSYDMDALPLFMEDIDSVMSPEVTAELKDQYAAFLVLMADSCFQNQKMYKGLRMLDKAADVAATAGPITERRAKATEGLASENFEMAKMEYENGIGKRGRAEDTEALIRAEYHTKLAMYYEEDYPGAEELLSKLYRANLDKYNVYEAVVDDKPDTNVYDAVNKYDIFMAVTAVKKGKGTTVKGKIYNYSYNPLRMRGTDFYLVNAKGDAVKASASSRIGKEILDQEVETDFVLYFPRLRGSVKKLEYRNGDHFTEKFFY